MRLRRCVMALAVLGAAAIGCSADDTDMLLPGSGGPATQAPPVTTIPPVGIRRLSQQEYENTVRDLVGETAETARSLFPADDRTPFDNDYATQAPSQALIEGADLAAADIASRLLADTARRDKVVGCAIAGPDPGACLQEFVRRFGRRALRRPLADAEIEKYAAAARAAATDEAEPNAAIDVVVRAFLQHPEFLYRIERGEPVEEQPGLFRLNEWEIASRLSYLLWGTTPDDRLLDRAASGGLETPDLVREAAKEMLADARAIEQWDRFHALWIGYEKLARDDLGKAMRAETAAMIKRIFDEKRPWQDVMRLEETFVSPDLAKHYGLPAPGGGAGWVPYGAGGRRGLLGQGTFLSLGGKFGDTSPTVRGLMIRTRLLCEPEMPQPVNVDVDEAPKATTSACKPDRYRPLSEGGCGGCHSKLDPLGFGLENYDSRGQYRTTEPGHPECSIEGKGELAGKGSFRGPGELGEVLLKNGLSDCLTTQLYRFLVGRTKLEDVDRQVITKTSATFGGKDFRLDLMLTEMVGSDAFIFRRNEQ